MATVYVPTRIQKRIESGWKPPKGFKLYEAQYRTAAGRLVSKRFGTKDAARKWLAAETTDIERGNWRDPRLARTSFDKVAKRWWEGSPDLRPTTRSLYSGLLRTHILPEFGTARVSDILAADIRPFVTRMLKTHSPATVNRTLNVLSSVMDVAVADGMIVTNPVQSVRRPRETQEEMLFLTAEQVADLANAIYPRFRALVLTAAYLGLRWGELAGLKRSKLNLLRGSLEVSEILVEVAGAFSFGPPKTKAGLRTVALPRFLVEDLRRHVEMYPEGDLVFSSADGSYLRRSNFTRRYWKPALRAAGLDPSLRFHDLRHTCVALLVEQGAHPVQIKARMGWSSLAHMLQRYGHVFPSLDDRLAEGLDAAFKSAEGGSERTQRNDLTGF